ncbi:hypothetical protein PILCRDRAFT_815332 [Piloderma croceum F 1598]|uniref:RNase III domain-containing protein n=1 Tax=Piloderma croceum (strain F 1598) TaxID=765440 RepID=A0A0C3CB05_PILCF|nr:hypothetical protein PILCRDRAFT_815332 [Piloderma croceum F 1598]
MSRSLARLNSSTRSIPSIPSGSVLAPPRTSLVLRRCLHASIRSRPEVRRRGSNDDQTSYIITRHNHSTTAVSVPSVLDSDAEEPESTLSPEDEQVLDSRFSRHLNQQFAPLKFPPDLAKRILTHGSHNKSLQDGHNARLGFVGRRVLHAYLLMFLHSSPASDSTHDYELIASRALNTYGLGQYVAPKWHLGRILRWHPTIKPGTFKYDPKNMGKTSADDVDPELAVALRSHPQVIKSVGLYKVMGEAVQAIVGGAYHQFGGSVTHRLFHTRILPHLLISGPLGLHDAYHADAYNKGKSLAARGLVRRTGP